MTDTKSFDLGTVLTVTAGRLLTDIDNLYNILGFMTGESLFAHQLPRASVACKEPLLEKFPKLAEITVPEKSDTFDTAKKIMAWLDTQTVTYGNTFDVTPLENFEHKNPLTELTEMTDKPVVVVVAEERK